MGIRIGEVPLQIVSSYSLITSTCVEISPRHWILNQGVSGTSPKVN